MKVVGVAHLNEFCQLHADARNQTFAWLNEAEAATWQTPHELKSRYPAASLLANNRVIFNIKGNCYRLDVQISYKLQILVIKRMGTHAEYDRWEF